MQLQLSLQLLVLQLLFSVVQAWPRDNHVPFIPRQTGNAYVTDTHPLPLRAPAPAPEPTSPPQRRALLKRATLTCGYLDGDSYRPIGCTDSISSCIFNSLISKMGCCGSAEPTDCTVFETCMDSSLARYWNSESSNTRLCSYSLYPECKTYIYGEGPYSGYTWHGCGGTSAPEFETVYWDPTTITTTTDTSTYTSTSTSSTSTSSISTSSSTSSTSTSTTSTSTSTPNSNPSRLPENASTPVGAIVGGVVGGLTVIALLLFGVFFLCYKKHKNATTAAQPQPQPQPQLFQPQPVVSQIHPIAGGAESPSTGFGGEAAAGLGVYPQDNKPTASSPTRVASYTGSTFTTNSPVPPYTPETQQMTTNAQNIPGAEGQYQTHPQQQQQQQQYLYAQELDTHRGDGGVRELVG